MNDSSAVTDIKRYFPLLAAVPAVPELPLLLVVGGGSLAVVSPLVVPRVPN
jgi:hypothetical protein